MKLYPILFASMLLVAGCQEEEGASQHQTKPCKCDPDFTQSTDSSFFFQIDTLDKVMGTDTAIVANYIYPIRLSAPAGNWFTYSWEPATGLSCTTCPSVIIDPQGDITYTLTVVDSGAVSHTFTIQITMIDCYTSLYIPNCFTPNGDGVNDLFYIYGQGMVEMNVKIKDGSTLLYESNDPSVGWDGTHRNNLVAECGNYDYFLHALYCDGTTLYREGEITLFAYDSTSTCPQAVANCRFGNQFDGVDFNPTIFPDEWFIPNLNCP